MKYLKLFEQYINESLPAKYAKGISKSTQDKKKSQMKKQAEMDDDDPAAYKEMPGDTKGKKNLKKGKGTSDYEKMFGDKKDESVRTLTDKELFEIYLSSVNEDENPEGDQSPISGKGIETGLKNKAEETGVPIGLIRIIMRRGMAAWKSGHKPGAGQEQWGYARVNAFLTKGKGTWQTNDKDVAKAVRDAGGIKKAPKK
tara:strand:+ start:9301 stop:9897 length:597 start_codon:yes stop_codon:yes gene_type:complete